MLIFGYGPRAPKDRGAVAPLRCPNCSNLTWYHLMTQRSSFSVFFVPLIPVKTEDLLVCDTCRAAIPLTRPQAARAADMVTETDRFRRERLSPVEYGLRVDSFWEQVTGTVGPGATPDGQRWPAGDPRQSDPWSSRADAPPAPAIPPIAAPPIAERPHDPFAHPTTPDEASLGRRDDAPVGEPPRPDPASRRPDPPAGWYPDPFGEHEERYWDGGRWTRGAR